MRSIVSCLSVCLLLSAVIYAAVAEKVETISVDVSSGNPVEVYTVNGDVIAEEWNSDQVEVTYTITCDSEEELDFINVECNTSSGIVCEVDYDDSWDDSHSGTVDFEVKIPSNINVEIEFASVNGDVVLDGGEGEAVLEVVNGDIIAENFYGELSVHCVNGDIEISESPGIRIAELVNGNIDCIINALEEDLELAAVSGTIYLDLGTDAEVEIETISGEIDIDEYFDAYITENIVGSSSEFGQGEYSIEISTVSGNITIDN